MNAITPKKITTDNLSIRALVAQCLSDKGYDGLWNDCDCACRLDDLMPCSAFCGDCRPGYLQPHGGDPETEFRIGLLRGDVI